MKGYAKQIKERNQATGENLAPWLSLALDKSTSRDNIVTSEARFCPIFTVGRPVFCPIFMAGPQRAPFIWPWEGQGLREALWRIGGPQPCWEIIIWGLRSFYEVWDHLMRFEIIIWGWISKLLIQREEKNGNLYRELRYLRDHRTPGTEYGSIWEVWVSVLPSSSCFFLPSSIWEVWVFLHLLYTSFFLPSFHLLLERFELS